MAFGLNLRGRIGNNDSREIAVTPTVSGHVRRTNKSVAPPASMEAINKLVHSRVYPFDKIQHKNDTSECGICYHRLIEGTVLSRMPCGHVYHINCLTTWLKESCTCPECRFEIETNDREYERVRVAKMKNRRIVTCNCKATDAHRCFFGSTKVNLENSGHNMDKVYSKQSSSHNLYNVGVEESDESSCCSTVGASSSEFFL